MRFQAKLVSATDLEQKVVVQLFPLLSLAGLSILFTRHIRPVPLVKDIGYGLVLQTRCVMQQVVRLGQDGQVTLFYTVVDHLENESAMSIVVNI